MTINIIGVLERRVTYVPSSSSSVQVVSRVEKVDISTV
jgi:hypothetical protein